MTLELSISIAAMLCGAFGIFAALTSRASYKNCRELLEFAAKQIEDLETMVAGSEASREETERKLKDQARRVAWLETRVRQPKTTVKKQEEILPEALPTGSLKANITERRHRILTLASRGQTIETIASTLGMMPGEVQLVMNLNRRQMQFA